MTKQYFKPRLRKKSQNPITMKKAIARDVLIRLSEGSLDAQSVYLADGGRYEDAKNAAELRSMFIDDPECTVCAIGAVFTSGIRLYNKVSPRVIDDIHHGAQSLIAQKWFTHDELAVMEMYFENCTQWVSNTGLGACNRLWIKIHLISKQTRMRAIFETIAKTGIVDETAIAERLTQCSKK